MMTFFEFFFSGPGWGWKAFALICFTSLFVELIPRTTNAILNYKLKKLKSRCAEHYRNCHKERELRACRAGYAKGHAAYDSRSGTRGAGDKRKHLERADFKRVCIA